MTFIDEVTRFGTLLERKPTRFKKTDLRSTFTKQAQKQIELMEAFATADIGWKREHWFERQEDGTYLLQLRRGNVALELRNGMSLIHLPNLNSAISLLITAQEAANDGQLDDLLIAAARAKRKAAKARGVR